MKKYLFYVSHLYAFAIVRPLQQEIRLRGGNAVWFLAQEKYCSCLRDDERRLTTVDEVMAFQADVVFVASNVVPDFFPGIKVQLFHGFNAQKRNASRGHFKIRGFFDLYCTQGPSTTIPFKALEKKYGFFRVAETGWSKVDPLFWEESNEEYHCDPPSDARPVVLFTSTFTPALSAAHLIYDAVESMVRQNSWSWIITFHPKMDSEILLKYKTLCRESGAVFYEGDDVIPLLRQADVMLSDTSSIISEFMLQRKPVVTFCNRVPGEHMINVTTPEDIRKAINYALTRPDRLLSAMDNYIADIHPYNDGCSSARVLAAVDTFLKKDQEEALRRKPLNFMRRLKLRLKHHYYKW